MDCTYVTFQLMFQELQDFVESRFLILEKRIVINLYKRMKKD